MSWSTSVAAITGLRYCGTPVTPSTYVPPYAGTTRASRVSMAIVTTLTTTINVRSATTMNLSRAVI